ncbi:MAG: tetratricopeptide repeat protein, partial [Cyclobacteriaceae bacterium]|nr:tetratricopeptide repeat protein [Cyclobacteriaceae bacterium]
MKKHILISGLAIVLSITQNYAQTPELVDSLLQNLNTATLDSVKADAMLSLSGVFRNSNPEKAQGYAQQALDLSRSINYVKGEASALFHFGAISSGQSDYSSALKYYQQALSLAENSTLKREPVQYKLNIGIIYDITGDAAKAMEIYEEVLDDSRVIKDTVLETSAFQNMAILHVYQGELSKAKEYFVKAKNVVEKINHPEMLGQITNNLATVYSQLYEFDSARVYYQESLDLWKSRNNQFQVARTMYNMAIDELETGSGQEAEQLWKSSLEIREQLGDARGVGLCQSALGSYYSDRRDYSKAVNFFQQSLRSFEKAGLK